MLIKKAHCFFEQSGTFKNEFIKMGIHAEDYDIQNNFGQTDHVIDLFSEIESAYSCKASIFDDISRDDIIMAFFPCIYFENIQMPLDTSCEQGVAFAIGDDDVPFIYNEKYGCNITIRRLTPRECFRLQGWTDDYFDKAAFVNTDRQLYKQAGNGVTVDVVRAVAESINNAMDGITRPDAEITQLSLF